MVNVAHNGHHRWTAFQISFVIVRSFKTDLNVRFRYTFHSMAELFNDEFCCISVQYVIRAHHLALLHHVFHDVRNTLFHAVCEV